MSNEILNTESSFTEFWIRHRRRIGIVLLACLAALLISSAFLWPYSYCRRYLLGLFAATGLCFSGVCCIGVLLALFNRPPAFRLILFFMLPLAWFAIVFCVSIPLSRLRTGPQFNDMYGAILMAPLYCFSVSWLLWLLRLHRSWRVVPVEHLDEEFRPSIGRELCCLSLTMVGSALLLPGITDGPPRSTFFLVPIFVATGATISIFLIVPGLMLILKSSRPVRYWAILGLGIPGLILCGMVIFQFRHYWQSGILVTEETKIVFMVILFALTPFMTFLLALRMIGYRLAFAKPWAKSQVSKSVTKTIPHPLD